MRVIVVSLNMTIMKSLFFSSEVTHLKTYTYVYGFFNWLQMLEDLGSGHHLWIRIWSRGWFFSRKTAIISSNNGIMAYGWPHQCHDTRVTTHKLHYSTGNMFFGSLSIIIDHVHDEDCWFARQWEICGKLLRNNHFFAIYYADEA